MRRLILPLVLLTLPACKKESNEAAPAPSASSPETKKTPETKTPPDTKAPPTEPASADACGDGKITATLSSSRCDETRVLFCKGGKPHLKDSSECMGEDEGSKVVPTTMAHWNAVWSAVDASDWKSGKAACADEPGPLVSLTIARDGVKKAFGCEGDLAPGYAAIIEALWMTEAGAEPATDPCYEECMKKGPDGPPGTFEDWKAKPPEERESDCGAQCADDDMPPMPGE